MRLHSCEEEGYYEVGIYEPLLAYCEVCFKREIESLLEFKQTILAMQITSFLSSLFCVATLLSTSLAAPADNVHSIAARATHPLFDTINKVHKLEASSSYIFTMYIPYDSKKPAKDPKLDKLVKKLGFNHIYLLHVSTDANPVNIKTAQLFDAFPTGPEEDLPRKMRYRKANCNLDVTDYRLKTLKFFKKTETTPNVLKTKGKADRVMWLLLC